LICNSLTSVTAICLCLGKPKGKSIRESAM
jgi:hypothetical protein